MGHLESMTQLLQEERDFYKRECELLRNVKEKSALMSPPTRERVTNYIEYYALLCNCISYYNSVNCDRPGECSPEKDCLR